MVNIRRIAIGAAATAAGILVLGLLLRGEPALPAGVVLVDARIVDRALGATSFSSSDPQNPAWAKYFACEVQVVLPSGKTEWATVEFPLGTRHLLRPNATVLLELDTADPRGLGALRLWRGYFRWWIPAWMDRNSTDRF